MVRIHDHYAPTDFMVLDISEEDDMPIILGRPFLNTTNAIIYVGSREVHFQFPREKVRCYFNSYTTYEQAKKIAPRGNINHPNAGEINSQRMKKKKL